MKKNLLLIHLESLNMLNYSLNPELFPILKEFEKQCIVFDRYYSTATSTHMVISDLLYGGMKLYEGCSTLGDRPSEYCYSSSLFDDLKSQGYHTGIYVYPDGGGDHESAKARHIVGFRNQMELIRKYSNYINSFSQKMNNPPFALMACNYISNISLNSYVDINNYEMDVNVWEAGYRCMDQCCGDILSLLKDKNLINDTLIILYGDHGDDYWSHGAHYGLTHAIEPNNLLIHTPLLIWDGIYRKESEHNSTLIQTTDLRKIINKLLNNESMNIFPKRSYAISRNEYAAQPIRAESFNKAYSIIVDQYLLMVSNKGLELYDTRMDPTCQCNLLRFFIYKNEVLKDNENNSDTFQFHFFSYWNSRQQRILRGKFYELKYILYNNVLELYIAGGRNEDDMLAEMNFENIVN